eukprot:s1139_g9.t1
MAAVASPPPAPSARRNYPRVKAAERVRLRAEETGSKDEFEAFCAQTMPTAEDVREDLRFWWVGDSGPEDVIEKPPVDAFRHDAQYTAAHISIAPPDPKLELTVRDTRTRPLPPSLTATHAALEQPLRSSDRHGLAPSLPRVAGDERAFTKQNHSYDVATSTLAFARNISW